MPEAAPSRRGSTRKADDPTLGVLSTFALGSLAAWLAVVVLGAVLRSRAYAAFRGVMLGIHSLIASALVDDVGVLLPAFVYLHATVFVHALALVRPRLMPLIYRAAVSVPSAFFLAGTFLALPWAVAGGFGLDLPLLAVPYVAAGVGVVQSLRARKEEVDLVVADGHEIDGLRRHPGGTFRATRPLRLAQITDPHLGPFMSVSRLQAVSRRVVESRPDLVLLTGDFLTMESQHDPRLLAEGFLPLASLKGRVFACFGNHDLEAPKTVEAALASVGARLLLDDAAVADTPAGKVQIVGAQYRFRRRAEHLAELCRAHPREPGALRLLLLHDPGAFKHVPPGEADLTLSGHTHGGQVGLVSLGLPYTMLRVFMNAPDHGFWALGTNRLYVHRGTGQYGFPLRVGVPAEESLVRVHAPVLAPSVPS